jgi:hypothetical protein
VRNIIALQVAEFKKNMLKELVGTPGTHVRMSWMYSSCILYLVYSSSIGNWNFIYYNFVYYCILSTRLSVLSAVYTDSTVPVQVCASTILGVPYCTSAPGTWCTVATVLLSIAKIASNYNRRVNYIQL